jgi:hypothetical protein
MFKNTDILDIYNDYDYKLYMDSLNPLEDYILPPKIEGVEPYYVSVPWQDIVAVNRKSKVFKHQKIRFSPDNEEEALKQLRIDLNKEKNSFSRSEVENMILNGNDFVLQQILKIDDVSVIDTFLSQLVALKNTGKYNISIKTEEYIRARKEELELNIKKTELEVIPTEQVDLGVVEEDAEEIVEDEVKDEVETEEKAPVKKTARKTTKK